MKCKNCKYSREVPGSTHLSCSKPSVGPIGVNEHGVQNGWFMFPINFDPIWADDCSGYVPINQNLDLSLKELNGIIKTEFYKLKAMMNRHFDWLSPEYKKKAIQKLEIAHNSFKGKSVEKCSKEELIEIIIKIQNV